MAARPEVVALLTDFEVKGEGADQRFVHRDGRPFTAEETELIGSTTDEDMRAAAGQLAAVPQRLIEMITPYLPEGDEDREDREDSEDREDGEDKGDREDKGDPPAAV
jgi:hypothetical protein